MWIGSGERDVTGVSLRGQLRPYGAMALAATVVWLFVVGCGAPHEPPPASPADVFNETNKQHMSLFGDFELPRKVGAVENIGLQLPVVSPDGERLLYLRSDQEFVSPMTLLGSADPEDTPAEGYLQIWGRPVEGNEAGVQISRCRWAHSPVWSDSGQFIAYVVNEPPVSYIVRVNVTTTEEDVLGVPDAINCLPRFNGQDETLLYCSGKSAAGPFRAYLQRADGSDPVALTPEGMDCLLPIAAEPSGQVYCARADGNRLTWVRCGPTGTQALVPAMGTSDRPGFLQTWAGIVSPLSPDRKSWLFYDGLQNRVNSYHLADRRAVEHRTGTVAACWLSSDALALAQSDWVFTVSTRTGISPDLMNGQWIPCHYEPSRRRLLLLGNDLGGRFKIVEVVFKTRPDLSTG